LDRPNNYGITPVIYALVNDHFYTFVYLLMGGAVELQKSMATWAVGEVIKSGGGLEGLEILAQTSHLRVEVVPKLLTSSIEH
jgi:hypothetical protein